MIDRATLGSNPRVMIRQLEDEFISVVIPAQAGI